MSARYQASDECAIGDWNLSMSGAAPRLVMVIFFGEYKHSK